LIEVSEFCAQQSVVDFGKQPYSRVPDRMACGDLLCFGAGFAERRLE
jgi:hypothetical protein